MPKGEVICSECGQYESECHCKLTPYEIDKIIEGNPQATEKELKVIMKNHADKKKDWINICSSCKRVHCEHVGDICPKCGGMIIKVQS